MFINADARFSFCSVDQGLHVSRRWLHEWRWHGLDLHLRHEDFWWWELQYQAYSTGAAFYGCMYWAIHLPSKKYEDTRTLPVLTIMTQTECGPQWQWLPILHNHSTHPLSRRKARRFRQSSRRHGRRAQNGKHQDWLSREGRAELRYGHKSVRRDVNFLCPTPTKQNSSFKDGIGERLWIYRQSGHGLQTGSRSQEVKLIGFRVVGTGENWGGKDSETWRVEENEIRSWCYMCHGG